jgi:hypothetical protein
VKHQLNTTIIRQPLGAPKTISRRTATGAAMARRRIAVASQLCSILTLTCILLTLASPIFGHGGFDHVIGTVLKVDNNVVTVKTAKGDVDVKLTDKTEITRGDQKAGIADLKPGMRVVIDVPEGNKDHVAHSIKLGVASAQHK